MFPTFPPKRLYRIKLRPGIIVTAKTKNKFNEKICFVALILTHKDAFYSETFLFLFEVSLAARSLIKNRIYGNYHLVPGIFVYSLPLVFIKHISICKIDEVVEEQVRQ